MKIDLQVHSTYSDGYLTPTELSDFLKKQDVKVASLTDHNTVGGLEEFDIACKKNKIKSVPGMELYTRYKRRKINILWYNYDKSNPELHKMLRGSQIRRRRQVRNILEALKEKGFKLDTEKIVDRYTHYVPINHVVDDFLASPYNIRRAKKELGVKEVLERDIIREYFKNGKIGRLKNAYIGLDRIIKLRKKIGGQLIICHPAKHSYVYREDLAELKKLGIDGIETLSPHHSIGAVMYMQRMSREFDYLETGGTDFHRFEGGRFAIQSCYNYFHIESDLLRKVKRVIG